jgi:MFS family permease
MYINTNFTWFLFSRMIATTGIKMVPVILGWYLYELTGSKMSLGLLGLSEVLPAILFALPAGAFVDRSERKPLIVKCLWAFLVLLFFLLMVITFKDSLCLPTSGLSTVIFGIVGITGWIRAYYSPASAAILAQLVGELHLVKAATTNSMSWLAAAITGPLLAGILIAIVGVNLTLAFALVCIGMSIIGIQQIKLEPRIISVANPRTWASVSEGLDFVFSQKALLGAMSLDMFAVLFGGVVALLPVFAKDILAVGPHGFGILMSATYIGNFMALVYFLYRPLKSNQGVKLIYAVGGFGVCILMFAFSTTLIVSFAALLISGLFDGVSMVVRGTIFQILVPDHMRGRVSSVSSIFINSSNELGQFESGVAATYMGTVPSVIFGGCMTLGIAVLAYFKIPSLRKLEYKP